MRKDIPISKLPEVLWHQIFKYLDIKSFISIKSLCKTTKAYVDTHKEIYERECIRLFTSGLELFR